MAAVSNQPSYTSLEPIPIPVEKYTALLKLVSRVVVSIMVTSMFAVTGLGLGLAEMGVTVITGVVIGSVIGVVASVVLSMLLPFPSRVCQYRLDTLKQVESVLEKSPSVVDTFKGLKKFLTYPVEKFLHTFQNHAIHDALTFLADCITELRRPDVKMVWKVFLEHLNHTKVVNADGSLIELDFSIELDRLEGKIIKYELEHLDSKSASYEDDLQQVEELQKVCFGKIGTFPKELLKKALEAAGSGCIVARVKGEKKIHGFAWFKKNKKQDKVILCGIGRTPGASLLKMGGELIRELILTVREQKLAQKIKLQVRKENPAVEVYKRFNFVLVKEKPHYYPEGPEGDAFVMELDLKEIHFKPAENQEAV